MRLYGKGETKSRARGGGTCSFWGSCVSEFFLMLSSLGGITAGVASFFTLFELPSPMIYNIHEVMWSGFLIDLEL